MELLSTDTHTPWSHACSSCITTILGDQICSVNRGVLSRISVKIPTGVATFLDLSCPLLWIIIHSITDQTVPWSWALLGTDKTGTSATVLSQESICVLWSCSLPVHASCFCMIFLGLASLSYCEFQARLLRLFGRFYSCCYSLQTASRFF